MDDVNVKGLRHVIDACRAHGVPRLVYTSSASGALCWGALSFWATRCVAGGGAGGRGSRAHAQCYVAAAAGRCCLKQPHTHHHTLTNKTKTQTQPTTKTPVVFEGQDLVNADEALPYASRPMDYYTATKIEGERMALAANSESLATCALRPSGIFGEGDTVMVPTLVRQARAGKMKYIIGDGKNEWDLTYVGNVAQAHLLAAEQLAPGAPAAGQAFFITNQEPVPFWAFTGDLLEGLGYR